VYASPLIAEGDTDIAELSWTDFELHLGGKFGNISYRNEILQVLRSVDMFKTLSITRLMAIVDCLTIRNYFPGEAIVTESEAGSEFFIIREGTVEITKKDRQQSLRLGKNDFFGERAVLSNELRSATVTAITNVSTFVLSQSDFLETIDDKMQSQLRRRVQLQEQQVILDDFEVVKDLT
jgi:cGMP-dependent protein kinase